MNSRIALGLALGTGLLVGFATGRLSASGAAVAAAHPAGSLSAASPSGDSRGNSDPSSVEAGTKTKRPERKPASGPRVSLPLSTVVESLRKTHVWRSDFENLDYQLPDAMTLLGIAKEDQDEVSALMRDIKKRVLAEEQQHLKVSKATDTEVVIDHRGMLEPAKQFAAAAQEGIRAKLPRDLADALVESINWDSFYYPSDQEPVSTFRIVRSPAGLLAQRKYQGGSLGMMMNKERYHDDGTAISIREAFGDDRWAGFLGDYKLLPVDDTE